MKCRRSCRPLGRGSDVARYRKIDPRVWNDEKFVSFSDDGKLAFLFVLTHPSMTAIGAMRALRDAGRRIPEDCSVIAIDGLELSAYIEPPLTTLCQPMTAMGEASVEILLDIIEGRGVHRHVTLPTALREGASVRQLKH